MLRITLFLMLLTVQLQAQQFSLTDAIKLGLEKNYDIRLARNEQEILALNHSLGNAGFFPTVSAAFDQNYANNDTRQEFLSGQTLERDNARSENTAATLGVNWTIFDGLKMFTTYEKLGEFKNKGEANLKVSIEATLANIIQAYAGLVQSKQQRLVAEKNVTISQLRFDQANQRFTLGSGSKMEMLQAQVDLNADKATLLQLQQVEASAVIAMNELLGRDANATFEATDTMTIGEKLVFEELRADLNKQNPSLLAAAAETRIAELSLKELNAALLPRVDLLGDYHWNRSQSEAGFLASNQNTGINYGLRASINLFNGFQLHRQRQQAKINIESAELLLEKEKMMLQASLSKLFIYYTNALDQLALEQQNLSVAEENLAVAQQKFSLGAQTSLELREAQRQLVAAETRLIEARFNAVVSRTELLRLSGKLLQ
jgi:outer membrane protein TolC